MSEIKNGIIKHDPALRFTANGLPVLTFDLIETGTGEVIHCVAWLELARSIANDDRFFTHNPLIDVRGYFKTREWRTREGTRSVREFIIQKIRITP